MWSLYDDLIGPIPDAVLIDEVLTGLCWTMVKAGGCVGVAATNPLQSRPASLTPNQMTDGLTWKAAAGLIKSWNFTEAGIGAAAINAFYNQKDRLENQVAQHSGAIWLPGCDAFSAPRKGLETKKLATIGHFHYADEYVKRAAEYYVLEREPREGDYPDSACEYLLPQMDYVYITGFTFINKTLPRLLELSRHAHVILVGPSVPMAPVLFKHGVDELAGTLFPDKKKVESLVRQGIHKALIRAGEPIRIGIER